MNLGILTAFKVPAMYQYLTLPIVRNTLMYKSLSLKLIWSQFSGKMWIIALTELSAMLQLGLEKSRKFFTGKMTFKVTFEWFRVCQAGRWWRSGHPVNSERDMMVTPLKWESSVDLGGFWLATGGVHYEAPEWTLIIFLVGYLLSWDFTYLRFLET